MIEIHLDGKPVTKLVAARALAKIGGRSLGVIYLVAGVVTDGGITVHARHLARGKVQPPEVSWYAASTSDRISAEGARAFAEAVAVAAGIAELAEMIAAEQDAPEPAGCPASTDLDHDEITFCDKLAGHAGNHHAAVSDVSGGFEVAWPNPCGARPYPAGSEGDDGTECALPVGHDGPHEDITEPDTRTAAQRARAGAAKSGFKPVATQAGA